MTVVASQTVSKTEARRGWLSWAAFLGMSWTWCIGMFLPVILIRDYGISGWIVFAVPNVLGAAAMGWVIRSRQGSEAIARTHRLAATLFSGVTIAFHLFFVISVIAPLAQSVLPRQGDNISTSEAIDLAAGGMLVASVLLYIYLTRRPDADRTLSWIVLAISLAAIACTLPDLLGPSLGTSHMTPLEGSSMSDLIWLAPVCVFGFLCCPYLDLTFHRAYQSSESSRASFGVGFVGLFLPMIVFTLLYARAMSGGLMTQWIAAFLYIHLAVQSAFTVAVHARELQRNARAAVFVAGILTIGSVLAFWGIRLMPFQSPLRIGEVVYRSFMGFYGLVFPAYVWLVMLPGRGRASPNPWRLIVYALAVLVALPMFAQGFLLQHTVWLAPGLVVVLVARLFIRSPKPSQDTMG